MKITYKNKKKFKWLAVFPIMLSLFSVMTFTSCDKKEEEEEEIITPIEFTNPIDSQHGGDPYIIKDGDDYYYTYTTGAIDIHKITSFYDTTPIESKRLYSAGSDHITRDIWAPEIHKFGNRWYIIACAMYDKNHVEAGTMPWADDASNKNDSYRFGFVLESDTEDIFGSYTYKGRLAPNGLSNIDGTYLEKDGKLYYVFSGYVDQGHQCIYIIEMENPYTIKQGATAVMLSQPEYQLETYGWKVNEGPAILYKNNDIFIVYSASGYSSGYYALGLLTLKGNDLLNADSWEKSDKRVFYQNIWEKIYNIGHCSFLYMDNGTIYMVYHATTEKIFKGPRLTYLKKVEFIDNVPDFGYPTRREVYP